VTLAVRLILSKKKGPVAVNMSTTRAVDDVARTFGSEVTRTPVGEIHVAKKMKSINAVIGGEGNGGVILPDLHLGRDAPVAAALALQALAESRGRFSDLWKTLPQYRMSKKKIEIKGQDPDRILAGIAKTHKNDRLDFTDGVRIDGPDWWVHIRKSNTEPVIRVIAEAKTREQADRVCGSMLQEVLRKS
jgi:phosphomannomutase